MTFEAGTRVGPFAIEEEIGRGGFATVYRANDARFGGPVAIKVLAAHMAINDEAVEQFVAEARALRAVENDAVVSVFDIGETDDARPYMVLQHADRGTLLDRLSGNAPATRVELARISHFFERALGALHERNMVHRDVKPSNVLLASGGLPGDGTESLLRPDDRLLLGDLGLVKDISAGTLTRGSGSAAYAAPEQRAVVSRVDARTDVYAASAVMAEAAIGRVRRADEPWDAVLAALDRKDLGSLGSVLARGLSEDPNHRPQSIADWGADLRSALLRGNAETEPSDVRSSDVVTTPERDTDPAAKRPWALTAFASLCLVAAIGAIALNPGQSDSPRVDTAASISAPDASLPTETAGAAPTGTPVPNTPVPNTPVPEATIEASGAANVSTDREPTDAESVVCGDPGRGTEDGRAPSGLIVTDVTASTMTIEWDAKDEPHSLFLNGRYLDNARKKSNQYVVEGLAPATANDIVIASHDVPPDEGALVCATTAPDDQNQAPVGLVMATDLEAAEVTATSVLLTWTPATSGGRYTMYSGNLPEGKSFPTIIGAGGVTPDETSFLFEDLEPGANVVVGLRTVLGENQSGLAWIEVQLPEP